jgi:integrase
MSGRRSNGEGTIYFNKARKRYEGQVSIRDPRSGKTTRRKVSGPTKARVLELIQEVKDRGSRGSVLPTTTRVGDWLEHWIADVLPSEPIKESTRASYIDLARRYLTPEIGGIRLTELQPADVRSLMTKMGKRELKGNTVRLARTVLNRALKVALVDGHITRNVAALTTGPRKDSTLQRTMTPEQVAALLEAASGDRIEALIHVLLATGLRRSEVLGLSWRDVDLVSRPPTISVVNALTAVNGRLVLGSPKTSRTRRRMFIPDKTADILKALKSRQNRERLVAGSTWGEGWSGHDFVFTTPLGTPLDPSNLRTRVGRILKDAGIGHWKIHEFRHTAASLMIAGGVPLKEVSEAMGHSSISITADVYGHLLEPSRATSAVMAAVMYR